MANAKMKMLHQMHERRAIEVTAATDAGQHHRRQFGTLPQQSVSKVKECSSETERAGQGEVLYQEKVRKFM